MKKATAVFVLLALLFGSAWGASPVDITLNPTQQTYSNGEQAIIHIEVVSQNPVDGVLRIRARSPEPDFYIPEPQEFAVNLVPEITQTFTYQMVVSDTTPPGEYTITAQLFEENSVIAEATTAVMVTGTLKRLEIAAKIAKDAEFAQKVTTVLKNQTVFLGYETNTANPTITATLRFPDGTQQEVALPTSITAEQVGSYRLTLSAEKTGYITTASTKQFAVIEQPPEIRNVSECNGNGTCETGENTQNCPQDCIQQKTGARGEPEAPDTTIYLIGFALLVVVVLVALLLIGKRK